MKKIILILLTVFLNVTLFSCTSMEDAVLDENPTELSPTGEDGDILPDEDTNDGDSDD